MAWNQDFEQQIDLRLALLQQSRSLLAQSFQPSPLDLDLAFSYMQRSYRQARLRQERKQLAAQSKSHDGKYLTKIARPLSAESVGFVKHREYGFSCRARSAQTDKQFRQHQLPDFVSQQLPGILKEHEFKLGKVNKIFASKWLNDSQVVFGTKCNKLIVLDLRNNNLFHIHSLNSSPESVSASCPCGIHSIEINPSRTMLATGGHNTNDLAVYELPTFDPLCVGEGAHKDWIFDMEWLDDQHIITGSRDSSVALWQIKGREDSKTDVEAASSSIPSHSFIKHRSHLVCQQADKVRALAVSHNKGLMGVLSMNARFHHWDIETFKQLDTINLRWDKENVCVTNSDDLHMFAVGSQENVTMLDHRTRALSSWVDIPCCFSERGIRSLSFNGYIITIGTGDGRVLFYDVRAGDYLRNGYENHCELMVGDGWLLQNDERFRYLSLPCLYPNAVYTHCYDENRSRLFVAGGPLPAQLYGNYAGLYY